MNIFNSLGSNYDWPFAVNAWRSWCGAGHALELKSYLKDKYQGQAILVYKGREAIELALRLLNLPENSVVAVNGFTCYAVYRAVVRAGCVVEYLDIEDSDLNFSPAALEAKLKENSGIKVLIVQNTLGYPCDIEKMVDICKKNSIVLIEDLAHSVGAVYRNNIEAGQASDFTALSFSQDKMIDGVSGGALVIRNKKYQNINFPGFEKVPMVKQLKDRSYPFFTLLIRAAYRIGLGRIFHAGLKKINLLSQPMDNAGSEKLYDLPGWYSRLICGRFDDLRKNLEHRRQVASIYAENINPAVFSPAVAGLIPYSANLRFPILVDNRDDLIRHLKAAGVHISDIWYDAPVAPKRYLERADYHGQCPKAEKVCQQILNLPTHKNVSVKSAKLISATINQWIKSK